MPDRLSVLRRALQPWVVLAALLAAGGGGARGGEAYYLVMYAAQRTPNEARYSHTFATFIRAVDGPPGCAVSLEAHTISWLPVNGIVRPFALLPEPGRNWGLDETIVDALCHKERVSLWGPYQVEPKLYHMALERKAELESGSVEYKAVDSGWPTNRASNCIHGVSSAAAGRRPRVISPGWGETASYAVLLEMRPWIVSRTELHPWIASALGLDEYPLIYRDFEAPRSGGIRGPISELLGRGRDATPSYGPPVNR